MSTASLETVEWHDLPVASFSITESGISLLITPYDDIKGTYISRTLWISDAESLVFTINGSLSSKDLNSLEVTSFDYESGPAGRLSGTIGLLPGAAGCWTVSFAGALWSLADS